VCERERAAYLRPAGSFQASASVLHGDLAALAGPGLECHCVRHAMASVDGA
jgi:hypothetical protein